jgi:hypothetical protein
MTSLTSLYAKDLMLELAARERRVVLFRKSCARTRALRAPETDFTEPDVYEQEMLARHYRHDGVKSYESGSHVL